MTMNNAPATTAAAVDTFLSVPYWTYAELFKTQHTFVARVAVVRGALSLTLAEAVEVTKAIEVEAATYVGSTHPATALAA